MDATPKPAPAPADASAKRPSVVHVQPSAAHRRFSDADDDSDSSSSASPPPARPTKPATTQRAGEEPARAQPPRPVPKVDKADIWEEKEETSAPQPSVYYCECVDPASGVCYYVYSETGESSWEAPKWRDEFDDQSGYPYFINTRVRPVFLSSHSMIS